MHSEETLALLRGAIAESTRATYLTATKQYEAWCVAKGITPTPLTEHSVAAWLTALASEGRLHSKTIRVYASALSTLHIESSLTASNNPMRGAVVTRLLDGIDRRLAPAEKAKRAAKPELTVITPDVLRELMPLLRTSSEADTMRWAAATLATCALLRPGELFGTQQKRRAGLSAASITFSRHAGSELVQSLPSASVELSATPIPDRFTIDLGASKSDQLARAPPHIVATPLAVEAMWRWLFLRRQGDAYGPELFRPAGRKGAPLSLASLLGWLTDGLTSLGYDSVKLTGKCFRRGGASALVAAGHGPEQVAARGRWKSLSMPAVYANAASKRQADLDVSRRM